VREPGGKWPVESWLHPGDAGFSWLASESRNWSMRRRSQAGTPIDMGVGDVSLPGRPAVDVGVQPPDRVEAIARLSVSHID
jgi:hypothetical protein